MFIRMLYVSATLLVASVSQAAVVGGVISGWDLASSKWVVMSAADGSQFARLDCGGDLTHGGSARYFR